MCECLFFAYEMKPHNGNEDTWLQELTGKVKLKQNTYLQNADAFKQSLWYI